MCALGLRPKICVQVDPREPGGYTKKQLSFSTKREKFPEFIAASPRGLVPAITTPDGKHVWESMHVVEYIDTVFNDFGDNLIPQDDPFKRAIVRIWADHCTERVQKSYYAMLMDQDPDRQQASKEKFFDECRALARAMAPAEEGPYFSGDKFCLVDVALSPFWYRFETVGEHYRGLTFPDSEAEFQRLKVRVISLHHLTSQSTGLTHFYGTAGSSLGFYIQENPNALASYPFEYIEMQENGTYRSIPKGRPSNASRELSYVPL
jgi:glutathione S-transferase